MRVFALSVARLIRSLLGAAALVAGVAVAQPAPAVPADDDGLYQSLGGQPGVEALVGEVWLRLLADPRLEPFFQDVEPVKFKSRLAAQFCEVSGGPCRYEGKDMRSAHAGQDISRANFNALVEVMQQALDSRGIAFGTQNRLLARLAPMHREVVNKH